MHKSRTPLQIRHFFVLVRSEVRDVKRPCVAFLIHLEFSFVVFLNGISRSSCRFGIIYEFLVNVHRTYPHLIEETKHPFKQSGQMLDVAPLRKRSVHKSLADSSNCLWWLLWLCVTSTNEMWTVIVNRIQKKEHFQPCLMQKWSSLYDLKLIIYLF